MLKAAEGWPVDLFSGNDYINLYHVFERIVAGNPKKFGKLRVTRRQIGRNHWRVFVLPEGTAAPELPPLTGYDPKRGRYKRYAKRLAAGEALKLGSKVEAVKARRAWQLYVPQEDRKWLRSSITGKNGSFFVRIAPRVRIP